LTVDETLPQRMSALLLLLHGITFRKSRSINNALTAPTAAATAPEISTGSIFMFPEDKS